LITVCDKVFIQPLQLYVVKQKTNKQEQNKRKEKEKERKN
jgi:hypothetical protein